MTKPVSRSDLLITATHEACLKALAAAPGGQLRRRDLLKAIEQAVPLDAWALEGLENSGVPRWHKIFGFSSVGMGKAGWVVKERGIWRITPAGRALLASPLEPRAYLTELTSRYQEWKSSQIATTTSGEAANATDAGPLDEGLLLAAPEERIEQTLKLAHEDLAAELISTVKSCDPEFFERLVVKLLLKMGYGGSHQEAGQAVGRSGDGGIDGVINEDRLGLDAIYIQAKRWEGSVGEGPIRDFKGALDAKGAHKGVFITTSTFTPAAVQAARNSRSYRIVLIDGARLAQLMIEHDLGVSVAATYQLKRLDNDFFTED
ncbi:restriction endonuclease [Aquabacterium sp.]|uniref:restriction endonuclease n=1 Tax=Aquabacterium sp. TaxID=1872578 RepID=UPI0035AFD762